MPKKKPIKKKPVKRKPAMVRRSDEVLPRGYGALLKDLKSRIRKAQVKAVLAVNRELIHLYWHIGCAIVERQEAEQWGQKIIDHLGDDIQREFPGISGFSRSNIYRMRAFFLAYRQIAIVPQLVGQLPNAPSGSSPAIVPQLVGQLPNAPSGSSPAIVPQLVGQLPNAPSGSSPAIVPQLVGQLTEDGIPHVITEIPWGHNTVLVEKVSDPITRLWYARQTIEQGWSRNVLEMQIDSNAHLRHAKAMNNFQMSLPGPQSDLVRDLFKSPYNFDFLTLADDAQEKHLHAGLLEHLREFLIELGVGFAFVGSRHHLQVGGQDYYLDLIFYHLKLRAFVVIDLKMVAFEPEHAGKMNFYLAAVDKQFRHPDDLPTIGLILCRDSNKVVVEYALRDQSKPIGVANYTFRRTLPKELRDSLPSVQQIQEELNRRRNQS